MAKELVITIVPGTPRLGIWCGDCLTSARYEIDLHAFGSGVEPWNIATIKRCDRCDDQDKP